MNLSEKIEHDLQHHVKYGRDPEYPLTLKGIASHFDASTQPVRTAVSRLLETGWLKRDDRGRLAVNRRKKCRQQSEELPALPAQNAYDFDRTLTDYLVRLSLGGETFFLREHQAADDLGVIPSRIRTGLHRLSGQGFIEHVPRRGWRVHAFSEKQMLDYLHVRENLELLAMEKARGKFDRTRLQHYLKLNQGQKKNGRATLDNSLHNYWIELADNPYITEFLTVKNSYYTYLFDYAARNEHLHFEMAKQHREILNELINENWDAAAERLREHIRAQRPNVGKLLKRLKEK